MEKSFSPEEIRKSEEERIENLSPEYEAQIQKERNKTEEMLDKLSESDYAILNELVSGEKDKAAYTDGLTGIKNRKALDKLVPEIIKIEKRDQRNFAVLMLDIDHFKKYNDDLGHQAGDDLLRKLPPIVERVIRKSDQLFRYGGEEFTILLPNTDAEGALNIAEKIRKAVEEEIFDLGAGEKGNVTISIGILSSKQLSEEEKKKGSDDILKIMIGKADKALYKAKEGGRNQSVLFHESMENNN